MKTFMSNVAISDHHAIPQRAKDFLLEHHNIDISKMFDPCPLHADFDGLELDWRDENFVNPPYSLIERFVKKAYLENMYHDKVTYFLYPLSKTDKKYFHKFLQDFKMIYFPFRLKFEGSANPSFQTHALVIMK